MPLVKHVDHGGGCDSVGWSIYEFIYTFCQFCCDLKSSLKTKISKGTMEKILNKCSKVN